MINAIKKRFDAWKKNARKLKAETYAVFLAFRHPDTPWYAKVLAGAVAAYAFSPIDLIPDFIPLIGYLDDLILIPLGIALVVKMIPETIMIACREQAQTDMGSEKPRSWFMAAIIILIWIGLAAMGVFWVQKLLRQPIARR